MTFDQVALLKLDKLSVHHHAGLAVILFLKKCCPVVIKVKPQQLPGESLKRRLGAIKSPEAELKMLSVAAWKDR